MLRYSDSEVTKFHPICEAALNQAISALGMSAIYEPRHHVYTGSLEMDYVVVNKTTGRYLCVVEVKRTPADVQSTRYQFQAQSYVQLNIANNEKPFYIITNIEKLISFRYNASKPSVYQQMLAPGLESICDISIDDETTITNKLAVAFQRLLDDFINDRYTEFTTLDDFLTYMKATIGNNREWKSKMAILMYEYIRGAFQAIHKPAPTITYHVSRFAGDIQQICIEANAVDFDGIFSYNAANYLPKLVTGPTNSMLSDIFNYGAANVSGDAIADALHSIISENMRHEGEVATDLELANLVSTLAKMVTGPLELNDFVCDPAAGSGNLINSAIKIFGLNANQIIANDCNSKLIELLSLRLGLNYSSSINKANAPLVEAKDIVTMTPNDFNNVKVVLLNPPFVAGINCVNRKIPFFNKISALKGSKAITEVGQQNLGAVFLELVCCLVPNGTTIACIFPKAHLTARGDEAVAFRQMLLGMFGLQCIVNYPGTGLFESVTEETCILIGKKAQISPNIKVYSSDVPVADIDLHALETYAGAYSNTQFEAITSDIEAREFMTTELSAAISDGWRMVCSDMSESINFVNTHIVRNPKITLLPKTTTQYRKGQVGVAGGSDLMFFDSIGTLYNMYQSRVTLDEGMRNAKCDDFILNNGDSKFLNFNNLTASLSNQIINDYIVQSRPAGQQQRLAKTSTEWERIAKKDGRIQFPANSILVPTKIRRNGRVHVSTIPLYVSTNFAVFSYTSLIEAQIVGSYMSTVFYQLECEVTSKDHAGVRKIEVKDAVTTHVPVIAALSQNEINDIITELPNVEFKDLNNPTVTHMDEIWAEILFGADSTNKLNESIRLLRFLANRRNPVR